MVIYDMTPEECRGVLERESLGRLACARRNQPYIVPIYFAFQGEYLYGFSPVGQKIEWMRANPCVCVEIDAVTSPDRWLSVIVTGLYEELPDTPESQEKVLDAYELVRKHALWWQPGYVSALHREPSQLPTPVFYRIRIDNVTGRRAFPDPVEAAAAGHGA
ncbi:MAG TPA: pyridoxamine 5'-phosphate oxidase family protein [Terriglobales bacterium]|nr:pyridoxamine 5'-phosphate oxidase family protein [Terriglobales bacterium]